MIILWTNADAKNDSLAPWEVNNGVIQKGLIKLPFTGVKLKDQELKLSTGGMMELVEGSNTFLNFDAVNLDPKLTTSSNSSTFITLLVTRHLKQDERVVFVRSSKASLIEWNFNSVLNAFDAIVSFRPSDIDASISFFIANSKNEVSEVVFTRKATSTNELTYSEKDFEKRTDILTDKKLSVIPFRPYRPTTHVLTHVKNLEAAIAHTKDSRLKFHTYTNLKSMRVLANKLKEEGVKVVTVFYPNASIETLTDEQRFFSRAIAEYFKFINIIYQGNSNLSRYFFSGISTIPARKGKKRKGGKPTKGRKPSSGKPTGSKPNSGKKPTKVKAASTYGKAGNAKPIKKESK